ncbi:helix-turn-helix domain-containing protein [Streptomyces durocortorensis]|uniref:Helix-turn-helix transcriptional regulator n=1 Tax=Streptomyces durocortorensis TaxID=2811104 RepID=A0ABS2HRV3_9ACTN|nr:helix-turn-helix transcriptional regulator [Streptomyces durocortorensis]MBM7052463.1 helix-turn-helix transcriptional regulator [Streptomyces durocortorensis]
MPARTFSPDALRRIRRERGVTQVKLAAKLGRTNTNVSGYENGHFAPSLVTLAAIADALDASMDDFMTRPAHELVAA